MNKENVMCVKTAYSFGYQHAYTFPENRGTTVNFCHFLFLKTSPELFSEEEFLPLDPTQELIFPPELMVRRAIAHLEELRFKWQKGPFQKLMVWLSDLIRDMSCAADSG